MIEKKISLYGISEHIDEIERQIERLGGEITEEVEDALVQVESAIVEKTDSYIGVMQKKNDLIKIIAEKRKEFMNAEKSLKNQVDRMKQTVVDFMERTGRADIKGTFEVIKIRKPVATLCIDSEDEIPMKYQVIIPETIEPKKDEIKKALKAGEIVGGCRLVDGKKGLSFSKRKV